MSGIVGIVNLDGEPVERQLLQQMTEFMAYRGPDAQDIWLDGHIGFGHTMLRTTRESLRERQPCSLDGRVWITADARVDGRADLLEKLKSKGRTNLETATDVDLILHAYHVWGEDCVKHLLGDFAFAIWDGHRQRLFCARDHFGVKPFYYAQVANCLIFSNTLNCLRLHPAVSDELNELAIADFLLFDWNQEVDTTTFADIQRLPGAHYLTLSESALRLSRYWTLPVGKPIRYKRSSDYVEHFRELMQTAVADRLRTDSVVISMSGGLDSTTLAATALEVASKQSQPLDLHAFTLVFDRLIPDRERYYSGLAAEALGIPIHYWVGDNYALYEGWDQSELRQPEPIHNPLLATSVDHFKQITTHSRVVLSGDGGDEVLCTSSVVDLLKVMPLRHIVADIALSIFTHRLRPHIGLGVSTTLKRWLGKQPWEPTYPTWLNETFATRLNLRRRWEQLRNAEPASIHSIRPKAYRSLTSSLWSSVFEALDPGVTSAPVEFRIPFLDLRLVSYLLAMPPIPWFVNKELLRAAMHGTLPEPVRLRPKTPLGGNVFVELLRHQDAQWVEHFKPTPELAKYVEQYAIQQLCKEENPDELLMNLRPLSLNYWLQNMKPLPAKHKSTQEYYEITA